MYGSCVTSTRTANQGNREMATDKKKLLGLPRQILEVYRHAVGEQ